MAETVAKNLVENEAEKTWPKRWMKKILTQRYFNGMQGKYKFIQLSLKLH